MKRHLFTCLAAALTGAGLLCSGLSASAANPYLPLWEYIPDGEPYVFEDPDNPGQYRVYIYGSHDIEITAYCGRNQVVWSAPVDDLLHWRYDGVIFESRLDADGQPLNPDGMGTSSTPPTSWKGSPRTARRPITCIPTPRPPGATR